VPPLDGAGAPCSSPAHWPADRVYPRPLDAKRDHGPVTLHQIRGHIPWSTVDARLGAGRSIWLATSRADGRPLAAPVWFWWDGDIDTPRLYFITARRTLKARNLARESWVEAHLGDGDDVVILRGRATIVDNRVEADRVDSAYQAKYVDPHSGVRASVYDNPEDDVYRLEPERVIAWSYGTVGTWTEWRLR
jgi:nitroimidazol reductase NimA-like FMN-containing flavoprotein (pyridoxamine 5'-phosphate oxidase superfamily)